jgi:hypothetical protein
MIEIVIKKYGGNLKVLFVVLLFVLVVANSIPKIQKIRIKMLLFIFSFQKKN